MGIIIQRIDIPLSTIWILLILQHISALIKHLFLNFGMASAIRIRYRCFFHLHFLPILNNSWSRYTCWLSAASTAHIAWHWRKLLHAAHSAHSAHSTHSTHHSAHHSAHHSTHISKASTKEVVIIIIKEPTAAKSFIFLLSLFFLLLLLPTGKHIIIVIKESHSAHSSPHSAFCIKEILEDLLSTFKSKPTESFSKRTPSKSHSKWRSRREIKIYTNTIIIYKLIFTTEAIEPRKPITATATPLLQSCLSILIVDWPWLWLRENIVCFGDFFEFFSCCFFIVRVLVRVPFYCLFSVSLFDFRVRCWPRNAQCLVVVFFRHFQFFSIIVWIVWVFFSNFLILDYKRIIQKKFIFI